MQVIMIKYGELTTKKGNRKFFVNTLYDNVKNKLKGIDCAYIRPVSSNSEGYDSIILKKKNNNHSSELIDLKEEDEEEKPVDFVACLLQMSINKKKQCILSRTIHKKNID